MGKELDDETGLVYMGARYLDSKTGRFIQPDPVGLVDPATGKINQEILLNPQRLNRYVYGLNNPYTYVDPDGKFAFVLAAAAGLWALDAAMPKSTDMPDSQGALDYLDNASIVVSAGAVKNVTKLPNALNALKKMPLSEAKNLMSKWSKGTFDSISDSIRYHTGRHGDGDIAKYLRKAASFNKKGAKKKILDDGATRWNKKNGEFLIEREGKIVTYGKNK
ncbi:MAG: RHS repeat-associated core domain-containing protein [Candidatus Electrothrix sp. ATG2]|nr:RHS repeat-associated core domain-containing protein [Candidatus Electrothrix sp. ATG2]